MSYEVKKQCHPKRVIFYLEKKKAKHKIEKKMVTQNKGAI